MERENIFRFTDFALDTASAELSRDGKSVKLQPQHARALIYLVRRAGKLVSREELQAAVWGRDTHVDYDGGLNWCIAKLRHALGDDPNQPRFIETLPKKGYRFIAAVSAGHDAEAQLGRRERGSSWRLSLAAAAALAVLAFVAGAWIIRSPGQHSRNTIVVLPFDNLTGQADGD